MPEFFQKYIDILISLEPIVKKAGDLSLELRKTAVVNDKFKTGIKGIDMVTNADIAVQEAILSEMAKTELSDCELFAEENTESVKKFKNTNGFTLLIDPIDGTFIYASTGRFFCTIIYLRKGDGMLYSLYYYPVLKWARRITKNGVEDSGELPKVEIKKDNDFSKTIVYTFCGPESMDKNIYNQLIKEGYNFKCLADITDESGSCTLFFLNQVAGYLTSAPNPHDGLGALHYGQQKGFKIYSTLDFTKVDPAEEFIFINSDNDPWTCDDKQGRIFFDHLGGTQIIKHEGHMGSNYFNQPYKEFPLLLGLIK